jgi:hypothetical protein
MHFYYCINIFSFGPQSLFGIALLLQTTFCFHSDIIWHLNSVFSILTWALINFKRVNDGDDTPNIYKEESVNLKNFIYIKLL